MSHQTGIKANDELKSYFAKCRDGKIRVLKISIENEQLMLSSCKKQESSWEKDYDNLILPLIEDKIPCYVLYRLDSVNAVGYDWLLISWCPDVAAVRQKMLYASTKATLKQEFGSALIIEELHGTVLNDITHKGYIKSKNTKSAPAPLTTREEELEEIRKSEINTDVSVDSKHQTLGGVQFPITSNAKKAIQDLANGIIDYLQLKIDLDKEEIHLECAEKIRSIDSLPSKLPTDHARYHLINFKHTHEGDYLENIVFIYSMPGYKCSIKERMLYSSCKGPLTDTISSWGIDIVKKLEIDESSELTEKFLYEEIHPIQNLHRPKFAKPKGPPGRGPKRLTRGAEN